MSAGLITENDFANVARDDAIRQAAGWPHTVSISEPGWETGLDWANAIEAAQRGVGLAEMLDEWLNDDHIPPLPPLSVRLVLAGPERMHIATKLSWPPISSIPELRGLRGRYLDAVDIKVSTTGGDAWRYCGSIHEGEAEMRTITARMSRGTPQAVADAVVAVFVEMSRINALMYLGEDAFWPEFYSRLASTGRCHQCNRPLLDPVSKVIGFGPSCAYKLKIPHSETIRRLIERRQARP